MFTTDSFHKVSCYTKGEWHGLAVSVEASHSKGRRIESLSFLFLLFVNVNVPRANSSEEMRCKEQVVHLARRKAGAEKNDESKRKNRQAFQEWIREVVLEDD